MDNPPPDLKALQIGDEAEWEGFFLRYWKLAYSEAWKRLRNHQDAEDVVLVAYRKIAARILKVRDIQHLERTLVMVVGWTALDLGRRRYLLKHGAGRVDSLEARQEEAAGELNIEGGAPVPGSAGTDQFDLLQKWIFQVLEEREALLIIGKCLDGFTGPELAEVHGLSHALVRLLIFRGLKKLRKEFKNNPGLLKRFGIEPR
jgi:RNA polymerase sigma factor (sigma-70 family)